MAEPDSIPTYFADDFNAISSLPTNSKPEGHGQLLEKIFALEEAQRLSAELVAYAAFLLNGGNPLISVQPSEPLGIIALRPLLSAFVNRLKSLSSAELRVAIAQQTVALIQPRIVSFEEADTAIKLLLADAHQELEDFVASAHALASIVLDTTQRTVTDTEKAQIWVRIARCYLEEDDPTLASQFINRAKNVLHNVSDKELRLHFQLSQARVLDSQRQFLEASSAYHNLSFEPLVDEDERYSMLGFAITCCILAPAGPQRARMLGRLYKDDRAAQTDEYGILEKIFLDRVLAPPEVAAFSAKLMPHQLAKTADGSTVVDRAVLEHNLLGASKLYRNIRVDDLGRLLGIDGDRAEGYAAQMIEQGRLAGYIDQIDGVIFFEGDAAETKGKEAAQAQGRGTGAMGVVELRRWDVAVQGLLTEVEAVTTMIAGSVPNLYAANMAL